MRALIDELALGCQTPPDWIVAALETFPRFVADHAANERKAAAVAMEFVVRYPDRASLVRTAARIAEEEIGHFREVYERMLRSGMTLLPDERDPYVRTLLAAVRDGSEDRLLDRLIVNALIEARGMERFTILAAKHPDEEWRAFYAKLADSERGHGLAFLKEAVEMFSEGIVIPRLGNLLLVEADAVQMTPRTGRFH